jgi:hypothetical protein
MHWHTIINGHELTTTEEAVLLVPAFVLALFLWGIVLFGPVKKLCLWSWLWIDYWFIGCAD